MDTGEFVAKVQDTQEKDDRNRRNRGEGSPEKKLSTKQHSTNK